MNALGLSLAYVSVGHKWEFEGDNSAEIFGPRALAQNGFQWYLHLLREEDSFS